MIGILVTNTEKRSQFDQFGHLLFAKRYQYLVTLLGHMIQTGKKVVDIYIGFATELVAASGVFRTALEAKL